MQHIAAVDCEDQVHHEATTKTYTEINANQNSFHVRVPVCAGSHLLSSHFFVVVSPLLLLRGGGVRRVGGRACVRSALLFLILASMFLIAWLQLFDLPGEGSGHRSCVRSGSCGALSLGGRWYCGGRRRGVQRRAGRSRRTGAHLVRRTMGRGTGTVVLAVRLL